MTARPSPSTPRPPRRSGVASMLAMLFLILFSVLAVGYFATATMSAQVARNERQAGDAQLATESGMQFLRYHVGRVAIPAATPPESLLTILHTQLATALNGQPNMAGGTVTTDGTTIVIPGPAATPPRWVELDPSTETKFRATITRTGQRAVVTVTGRGRSADVTRVIRLEYALAQNASSIFNFGVASRSPISMNSNARIRGATDPLLGSVLSTTTRTPALLMSGNSQVSGDVSFVNTNASTLTMDSNSTIAGLQPNAAGFASHVHRGVTEPEFPTVDTSAFLPYATNVLSVVGKKYDTGVLSNVRIRANTNPIFDSNMEVRGVIYIETPNRVEFQSNVVVRGVIVVQNNPNGDETTNTILFNSNVKLYSVDTLPATALYPAGLRALTGSMILAPKFAVTFNSNFGSVGGTIIADKLHFDSNATGTVRGSVINLADTSVQMDSNAEVSITSTGTSQYPAGVFFGSHFAPLPGTYVELPME